MTEAMRFGQQQQEVVRRLFAMGLRELMDDLEMTQADLARAVWGTKAGELLRSIFGRA